jgi:DNA invertase Pin-like site-specific DNA recombinase
VADDRLSPVSTGGQDLAQQKLVIFDYARKHRLTVDNFVKARASAGSSTPWAQLLALMETLQTGDRLMVSELARLGRPKGGLGESKLDGKRQDIQLLLRKCVSKASIA